VQRAKDLLNMRPLRHILIGLVVVPLRDTLFTKQKWAQAIDMNHGLNLGGIELICEMEGNKKGCKCLVWSSGTVKDVHRAVERKMKTFVSFKLIGERHQDVCVENVELDLKQCFIYLIKHYGLEEKSLTIGCEISITADGAKLDEYCCRITCCFKITDPDPRDPLTGKLLFEVMQSERNCHSCVSLVAKDNKATYDEFLTHVFDFCQELRGHGISELCWKQFKVAEPKDMKSSQLCTSRGGAANQIPYFCHLCQNHSDDIARPDQLPCSKCVLIKGKVCYCYSLMDPDVVADLRKKREVLDSKPEAERLTFVCEQMYDGDWQQYYLACNLHLVPIGTKPSIHVVPPKSNKTELAAYVKKAVRTLSTLGITCAMNTSLLKIRKQIVRELHSIYRYCPYNDALAFGESVKHWFNKSENQLPCVLHLHKRVI
jgi:hypothetical protein